MKEKPDNTQLALLIAGMTIPVLASAKLLSFAVARPLALAVSVFVWYQVIYWASPKPRMNPWLWLAITLAWCVATYLLAFFEVLPF